MARKPKLEAAKESADERKTCFVIMPISDVEGYPSGHFSEVYKQLIEPAVVASGYDCALATSTSAAHMIQLEVVTKVATADLCICDLSTNNPNVLFEYGIRQAFDKPTVLIKDDKTRRIFDLSGFRDIEYDHTLRIANTLRTRDGITTAITDTVNGAGDASQVFSLVQLMKLTKAALPTGEVNREDARFALIEKKLDGMVSLLSPTLSRREQVSSFTSPGVHRTKYLSYLAEFSEDGVRILDAEEKQETFYKDQPSLERSTFWRQLSKAAQQDLLERLYKFSKNFIPF